MYVFPTGSYILLKVRTMSCLFTHLLLLAGLHVAFFELVGIHQPTASHWKRNNEIENNYETQSLSLRNGQPVEAGRLLAQKESESHSVVSNSLQPHGL